MKKFIKVISVALMVAILFISFGAISILAAPDQSGEFVANGGFEDGLNSWAINDPASEPFVTVSEDAKLEGSSGLDLTARSDRYAARYQIIDGLVPGTTYTMSFYAKNVVNCVPSEGKIVGSTAGLRMTLRANSIEGSPAILFKYYADNQSWSKYTTTFTTPAETTSTETPFYLAFYLHSCTAGQWYVDNVRIYENNNLMLNGDIESYSQSGITNWAINDGRGAFKTNYFADSEVKYEGLTSLKVMSHDGTDPTYAATATDLRFGTKVVGMVQGKTYKLSFKIRASNTSVKWWIRNYMPADFQAYGTLPTANEWYEKAYYFKAGAPQSGGWTIYFGISGSTPHGTVWYDDFNLTEVSVGDVLLGYDTSNDVQVGTPIVTTLAGNIGKTVNNSTVYALGGLSNTITDATLILGIYTVTGGVKTLSSISVTDTIGTAVPTLKTNLAIPATGSYEVQAFIWDSLAGLQNLSKKAVLQ